MKYCVDCRWFVPKMANGLPEPEFSKCRYVDRRHMVTGQPDHWYAIVMRNHIGADRCGPGAQFFMPIETSEVCHGE